MTTPFKCDLPLTGLNLFETREVPVHALIQQKDMSKKGAEFLDTRCGTYDQRTKQDTCTSMKVPCLGIGGNVAEKVCRVTIHRPL